MDIVFLQDSAATLSGRVSSRNASALEFAKYGKLFVESWRRQAETKSLPGTRHRLLWHTISRTAHKHSGALSGVFHGYIMGVSYGTVGGILWHFRGYPMGILGILGYPMRVCQISTLGSLSNLIIKTAAKVPSDEKHNLQTNPKFACRTETFYNIKR